MTEQLRVTLPSSGISDVGATSAIGLLQGMYCPYPGWRDKDHPKITVRNGGASVAFSLHT